MKLCLEERRAARFHRDAKQTAFRVGCDLVGTDHAARTVTLRHFSKPDFHFTVPIEWLWEFEYGCG